MRFRRRQDRDFQAEIESHIRLETDRLIAEGIRAGELVDMDQAIVARAMLGAMNWTVTWFRPEGANTAAVVGDVISRFLVRGISTRTPAVKRSLSVVRRHS